MKEKFDYRDAQACHITSLAKHQETFFIYVFFFSGDTPITALGDRFYTCDGQAGHDMLSENVMKGRRENVTCRHYHDVSGPTHYCGDGLRLTIEINCKSTNKKKNLG